MAYNLESGATRRLSRFQRLRAKLPSVGRKPLARRLYPEFGMEGRCVPTVTPISAKEGLGSLEAIQGSPENRKIFTELQLVPVDIGHATKKEKESVSDWFFHECMKVNAGIEKDKKKIEKRLESEKSAYHDFIEGDWPNKTMLTHLEFTIGRLECDVKEFPDMVIRTMCNDMLNVLNRGSALSLLRHAGPKAIYDGLIANYVNRWKTILYQRAVYEFLFEIDEEGRWDELLLGVKHIRAWLVSRCNYLFDEPTDEETAEFIVEMLFPAKDIKPSLCNDVDAPDVDVNSLCLLPFCAL